MEMSKRRFMKRLWDEMSHLFYTLAKKTRPIMTSSNVKCTTRRQTWGSGCSLAGIVWSRRCNCQKHRTLESGIEKGCNCLIEKATNNLPAYFSVRNQPTSTAQTRQFHCPSRRRALPSRVLMPAQEIARARIKGGTRTN